jgi:hypothetical protein
LGQTGFNDGARMIEEFQMISIAIDHFVQKQLTDRIEQFDRLQSNQHKN